MKVFSYHLKILIWTFGLLEGEQENDTIGLSNKFAFLSQVISSSFTINKIEWESNQAANWYDIQNNFLWWIFGQFLVNLVKLEKVHRIKKLCS